MAATPSLAGLEVEIILVPTYPPVRFKGLEAEIILIPTYPPVRFKGLEVEIASLSAPPLPPGPVSDSEGNGEPGVEVMGYDPPDDYVVKTVNPMLPAWGAVQDLGAECVLVEVFTFDGDAEVKVFGVDGVTVVAQFSVVKNGYRSVKTQGRYVQVKYKDYSGGSCEITGLFYA